MYKAIEAMLYHMLSKETFKNKEYCAQDDKPADSVSCVEDATYWRALKFTDSKHYVLKLEAVDDDPAHPSIYTQTINVTIS